jgi:pimeloyl-ACP methyl ester carboxylesterase
MSTFEVKSESLHGRSLTYAEAGEGPVLLLVHGLGGSYENWMEVIEPLARTHTVIAPDLPGHGTSVGGGDYSVGALASSLRDLLFALGKDRATLIGHSLGGGVAMQFAYQFPEMVERLVLVSSGGLGPEVSFVLRAASLPGADPFIAVTADVGRRVGPLIGHALSAIGLRPNADVAEVLRGYGTLVDPERRTAFLSTVRAVIGVGGQRVAATDRLYLAEAVPVLIIWGAADRIIPASHGEDAHHHIPGCRFEVFEDVGHLPQIEAPLRFVLTLEEFLAETEPASIGREDWSALLQAREAA